MPLRLVRHLEGLADRPESLHRVGHRLEDVRVFWDEILAVGMAHGVTNVRVFGSVARGDSRPDSDVDFLVDVVGEVQPWFPVELMREWSGLLGRRVDVGVAGQLRDRLRERVLAEAVVL